MIKIQKKDFSIEKEINNFKLNYVNTGAVSSFIGYVRDINNNKKVKSIFIEVYYKMALEKLKIIIDKEKKNNKIFDCLIIHRYGKLYAGEKIVMVTTLAKNRKYSFLSCQLIMDYLKKDAPFWKKEIYKNDFKWLENIRSKN